MFLNWGAAEPLGAVKCFPTICCENLSSRQPNRAHKPSEPSGCGNDDDLHTILHQLLGGRLKCETHRWRRRHLACQRCRKTFWLQMMSLRAIWLFHGPHKEPLLLCGPLGKLYSFQCRDNLFWRNRRSSFRWSVSRGKFVAGLINFCFGVFPVSTFLCTVLPRSRQPILEPGTSPWKPCPWHLHWSNDLQTTS